MDRIGMSFSEDGMSYNNKKSVSGPYLVYLKASSVNITAGEAIPYVLVSGTSGHGITVSSGVVTLPSGDWLCYATADTDLLTASLEAQWYVDSTINNDFPGIVVNAYQNTPFYTDMKSSAITLKGGVTVELRSITTSTVSIDSECDLVIYGVRT